MRKSDFFTGLIVGGLIGAAIALLYTPDSGKRLREQVRDYASNLRQEVKKATIERRVEMEQELAALRAPLKTPEA